MIDFNEILNEAGEKTVKALRDEMSKGKFNASGNTSRSITYEASDNKATVYANSNIYYLVHGRGPSKGGGRQGEGLYRRLIPWAKIKFSVDDKESRRIAFFVSRKIHKFGTAVYRGDRKGIDLASIRKDVTSEVSKKIKIKISEEIKSNIKK